MHLRVKTDQNEQSTKKRHIVTLHQAKSLHGYSSYWAVNCLRGKKRKQQKEEGKEKITLHKSGLSLRTLHEELITSSFKTGLLVCFQFEVFMAGCFLTLN